jgi:predicted O-methyltransferase YrrM
LIDNVEIFPNRFKEIEKETKELDFDQVSDPLLGSLLSTLVASKPRGNILELGTGTGLSTSFLLQGMDNESSLVSIDNEGTLVSIAKKYLGSDSRVNFIVGNGEDLILDTKIGSIDFIFADTWPGKYNHLEETLDLLRVGGIYLIDDMLPQENWPEAHSIKATNLIEYLENRKDFLITKMCWSTGIIICTRK